jgi:tRNA-uridine 2-sulfurtransferase
LPVADKVESQEICFVGNRSYADFVAARRPDVARPGEIVSSGGQVLGQHRGLVHHTFGQRRGIGIAAPKPYFVLRLDTEQNRLVVGGREDAEATSLAVDTVSLTAGTWPAETFTAEVAVRYRGAPTAATVVLGPEGERTAHITFGAEGGPIASPGQAVVLYRGDEVLGGGTIHAVTRRGERTPAAATA